MTIDPNACALRRSPTVQQEVVKLSDGKLVGLINGDVRWWEANGSYYEDNGISDLDLIPLQTPPVKALQFFVLADHEGRVVSGPHFPGQTAVTQDNWRTVPMIERAPGDALRDTLAKWLVGGLSIDEARAALAAYREATE